jgi:heterotetrameric sarcosine oxidase gamma subunit
MADVYDSTPTSDVAFRCATAPPRSIAWIRIWEEGATIGGGLSVAGQRLPTRAGAVLPGRGRFLCLGPGNWLRVDRLTGASAAATLAGDAAPVPSVDISTGLAVLGCEGAAVRRVLAKSSGLDFDPEEFPANYCSRTRLARIPVIVKTRRHS